MAITVSYVIYVIYSPVEKGHESMAKPCQAALCIVAEGLIRPHPSSECFLAYLIPKDHVRAIPVFWVHWLSSQPSFVLSTFALAGGLF